MTEILMAVGILGIGMTMVASVFPVAVDQSRRSTELTMAALSARSVSAVLRARRREATPWLRSNTMVSPASGGGSPTPQTKEFGTTVLPYELRNYNPANFLYSDSRLEPAGAGGAQTTKTRRRYTNSKLGMYGMWGMGSYVPVVFATPMSDSPTGAGHGPWRITILVYKSRGQQPGYLESQPSASWVWSRQSGTGVGTYVMDWRFRASSAQAEPNTRGEAYKVQRYIAMSTGDRVVPAVPFVDTRPPGMLFQAFVAGGDQNQGTACYGTTGSIPAEWVALPGAVAAYHTILGD